MPLKSVSELPNEPAVYAMYGGRGRDKDVAYVGIARKLKQRIQQHLVRRDSSVTTGVSAVSLNPEHVTKVSWWEHQSFSDDVSLNAAELIAFEELNPDLRSRGNITTAASELSAKPGFRDQMKALFQSEPTGTLFIPTLNDALQRIDDLEERLASLEKKIG